MKKIIISISITLFAIIAYANNNSCTDGTLDVFGVIGFKSCEVGTDVDNNETDLCPIEKTSCNVETTCKPELVTYTNLNEHYYLLYDPNAYVLIHQGHAGWQKSAMDHWLMYGQYEGNRMQCTQEFETVYTCPHTDQPCVLNAGKYECSPYDCYDMSSGGNYTQNEEETEQGANDYNNNGTVNADGSCADQLIIFPGSDMRCRTPGAQTMYFQCCQSMSAAELESSEAYDKNICSVDEKQLWVQRGNDACVEVGDYCTEKWFGKYCVQKKVTHCCFTDEFQKAFVIAGKDLLGEGWGTPESPNCGGFSPEQLQELGALGISDHPAMQAYAEKMGAEMAEKMTEEMTTTLDPAKIQGEVINDLEGLK